MSGHPGGGRAARRRGEGRRRLREIQQAFKAAYIELGEGGMRLVHADPAVEALREDWTAKVEVGPGIRIPVPGETDEEG